MKTALTIFVALAVGFAFGWFTLRIPFIVDYNKARAMLRLSADDYIKMIASPEETFELTVPQQKMSHVVAFSTLRCLESGKTEEAEKLLVSQAASYYYIYGPPDHPQKRMNEIRMATLLAIKSAMERHPALKEKIEDDDRSREK